MEASIQRQSDASNPLTEAFFAEAKNGGDSRGDYPYAYWVVLNGEAYIGFSTNLPSSRDPWEIGFVEFDRDTVLRANDLSEADEDVAAKVNALVDIAE